MKPWTLCFLLFNLAACSNNKLSTWVMIDVTEASKQADAHLIVFGSEDFGLIDTGFSKNKIIPFLEKHKISHLKNIWISHPHKDHYGGVQPILEAGIKVDRLRINVPSKSFCDIEKPWGCDYEHLTSVIALAKSKGVIVSQMKAGETLHQSPKVKLEALVSYSDKTSPTGRQGGINDTSVIMALTTDQNRVLFTGDLNAPLGEWLSKHSMPGLLKADLIKVPHHGTEGCAPNSFFDLTQSNFAFVTAPEDLWLSERSKRIREYWLSHAKQVFISGIHGTLSIDLTEKPASVTKEKWWNFK
ncbi:MAG: MBL fold metallo-hydrolase [Xanthomonadaceae bacterium]|nr:MBL fold metallo-hydrolase [Xanthomonadaceae bacterium]